MVCTSTGSSYTGTGTRLNNSLMCKYCVLICMYVVCYSIQVPGTPLQSRPGFKEITSILRDFLRLFFCGFSWRVTSKQRGSTLIQVARRRSKVFQRFSASLVRVGDVQGVSRRHACAR